MTLCVYTNWTNRTQLIEGTTQKMLTKKNIYFCKLNISPFTAQRQMDEKRNWHNAKYFIFVILNGSAHDARHLPLKSPHIISGFQK